MPLSPASRPEFYEWLANTDYPDHRKKELAAVFEEFVRNGWSGPMSRPKRGCVPYDLRCKSFSKVETYPEFKYARSINSRSDKFKVFSGPLFAAVESALFARPEFIKHIAVKDRPAYIFERLSSYTKFYVTDYTSFEGSFSPEIVNACEMQLYEHMLGAFPEDLLIIRDALTGVNQCDFRDYSVKVEGTRMSGDMCTSLGNGFTNLMLSLFTAYKSNGSLEGVFEGDDAILGTDVDLDLNIPTRLGFLLKQIDQPNLYLTSFCGLMLSRELTAMADPRKVLLNFGWSHSPLALASSRMAKSLCRAKAMSLVYEYPRCPIVTQLALTWLSRTEGVKARFSEDWYHSRVCVEAQTHGDWVAAEVAKGISVEIRQDFAIAYGVGVTEQLAAEEEIKRGSFLYGPFCESLLSGMADAFTYRLQFVDNFGDSRWTLAHETNNRDWTPNGVLSKFGGVSLRGQLA